MRYPGGRIRAGATTRFWHAPTVLTTTRRAFSARPPPAVVEDGIAKSSLSIDLPPYGVSLTDFMDEKLSQVEDQSKLCFADANDPSASRTFAQVRQSVENVAFGLSAFLRPGDFCALMLPNHVDFYACLHGAMKLGAVVTLINPLYKAHDCGHQMKETMPKVVLTHSSCVDEVRKALELTNNLSAKVLEVDSKEFGRLRTTLGVFSNVSGKNDDVCVLPYSSGTTGLPKGVMLTHDNLISNLRQCYEVEVAQSPAECVISPLPVSHIYAFLVCLHLACMHGTTFVTMSKFDLNDFCVAIEKFRPQRAYVVPPIVLGLCKSKNVKEKYDLSSLKVLVSAAAPLGLEVEDLLRDRFEGELLVKQLWGMTELSPLGTGACDSQSKPGSVGPPAPQTEIKIVDPSDESKILPVGEEGHLLIRGPQVMKGYFNNPNSKDLDPETRWFKSGDVAKIDSDGFVYICDRIKELIKVKGFQVAPAELEAVLLESPLVADACVVPVEDEESGELPKAYVVLSEGVEKSDSTANEISLHVEGKVAHFKRIRGGVAFVDSIPKTASGKLLRREVIAMDRK